MANRIAKLLLTGSRIWEIDWYQHERPWPLFRGRLRSCPPLRHIRHWISRKPLVIKKVPKDHQ